MLGGLGWSFFDKSKLLNHYYLTFLIILIPFVIVNSILTGSFIEGEVVWYNNAENLGIASLTIPTPKILVMDLHLFYTYYCCRGF